MSWRPRGNGTESSNARDQSTMVSTETPHIGQPHGLVVEYGMPNQSAASAGGQQHHRGTAERGAESAEPRGPGARSDNRRASPNIFVCFQHGRKGIDYLANGSRVSFSTVFKRCSGLIAHLPVNNHMSIVKVFAGSYLDVGAILLRK